MINKHNLLGKAPGEIGTKDAIHVAIVAVRAGEFIAKGQRFRMNEFNEAVANDKGFAVADPFRKSSIAKGEVFWGLIDQADIPNVTHVWDHPSVKDFVPNREVQKNKYLNQCAVQLGITYEDLMAAMRAMTDGEDAKYAGPLSQEEAETLISEELESYEMFSEWADETGHEFDNNGTSCCPEYDYPDLEFIFEKKPEVAEPATPVIDPFVDSSEPPVVQ